MEVHLSMEERRERLAEIRPGELTVLEALAVLSFPSTAQVIAQHLGRVGLRTPERKKYLGTTVRRALHRLASLGWVDEGVGGHFRIHPEMVGLVLRTSSREGRLATLAQPVLEQWDQTVGSPQSWHISYDPPLTVNVARLALYLQDGRRFQEAAGSRGRLSAAFRESFRWEFFAHDPDPAVIRWLPPQLGRDILVEVTDFCATAWIPLAPLAGLLEAVRGEFQTGDLRAQVAVLSGVETTADLVGATGDVPTDEDPFLPRLIEGLVHLAGGDFAEARKAYATALKKQRPADGVRWVAPPFPHGVFYLGALLQSGQPPERRKAKTLARNLVARTGYRPLRLALDALVASIECDDGTLEHLQVELGHHFLSPSEQVGPEGDFLTLLLAHWAAPGRSEAFAPVIGELWQRATEAGFAWQAEILAEMAASAGVSSSGDHPFARAALARDSDGDKRAAGASLLGAANSTEPWERQLSELEEVAQGLARAGGGGKKGVEQRKRLVWVVGNVHPWGVDIRAREQTRSKSGGWTRGRNVANSRLAQQADSLPFLTEQDRAACRHIHLQKDVMWHREDYVAREELILELAGHPLVFRDDDFDAPVQVERAEAALDLKRVEGGEGGEAGWRLTLNIPKGDRNVKVEKVSPRLLRVTQIRPEHRKLAKILGPGGITFPADARGRLVELAATLAPVIPLRTDLPAGPEGAAALGETVAGQILPHVRLLPAGEGLSAQVLVYPAGGGGDGYPPGGGRAALIVIGESGRPVQVERDLEAEARAAREVVAACPALASFGGGAGAGRTGRGGGSTGWLWMLDELGGALSLLEEIAPLQDAGSVVVEWPQGQPFAVRAAAGAAQLKFSIRRSRGWFEASGSLRIDEDLVLQMGDLLAALDAGGGRFVALGGGQFLALTESFRRQLEALKAFGQPGAKGALRIHPGVAPAIEDLAAEAKAKTTPAWREHLRALAEGAAASPDLPSTLQADLRPYQEEGFRWMARLSRCGFGACLADDMGLGKTVQALALILDRAPQGPSLVLAPTSVCANWVREAARFAPTLRLLELGSAPDRGALLGAAGPFDLVVGSYGLLQTEGPALAQVEWASVVLDEAQAIKNPGTKRSKAAMKLVAGFRLATTGTPVENRLSELWNLFQFINPGLLGSAERFRATFAEPIEKRGDTGAGRQLKRLISPFVLRRLKAEVLDDLPPLTEIELSVEPDEPERAFYEALRRRAVDQLAGGGEGGAGGAGAGAPGGGSRNLQILAEITRLRMASCHPRLVEPGCGIGGAKLKAFADLVDELHGAGHKALVFSQFLGHLKIVREHLEASGVAFQYLDGATPAAERQRRIDAFQAGQGEVFLISLRAGGSGLNLTAADYVVHLDPWWNPAVEDQASQRAHRIGQTRPVTVYRLVMRGTIEEQIVKLHREKRDLADRLLEGADAAAQLTPQELLQLIAEGA